MEDPGDKVVTDSRFNSSSRFSQNVIFSVASPARIYFGMSFFNF